MDADIRVVVVVVAAEERNAKTARRAIAPPKFLSPYFPIKISAIHAHEIRQLAISARVPAAEIREDVAAVAAEERNAKTARRSFVLDNIEIGVPFPLRGIGQISFPAIIV